jgi:cob(I)alamin adenosyltransferase
MSARSPIGSIVATTRGDDGTTGLLFGGARITKDDPRAEAYGTIDEAVAALGLARANLGLKRRAGTLTLPMGGLADLILRFQRELFVVGAELATNPEAWDRLEDGRTRVSAAMVEGVETLLLELEATITMPTEFVVPGETMTSAALELARTILRRAERRAVALRRDGLVPGDHLLPYINRLADLLWVLARAAEQAESRSATPARTTPPRTTTARKRSSTEASSASHRDGRTIPASKEEPA